MGIRIWIMSAQMEYTQLILDQNIFKIFEGMRDWWFPNQSLINYGLQYILMLLCRKFDTMTTWKESLECFVS